jgi:hypothetical protein
MYSKDGWRLFHQDQHRGSTMNKSEDDRRYEADQRASLEKMVDYFMKKDGLSRKEAIRAARRTYLLTYLSSVDVKDRPEVLKAIEEVGGL